MSSHKTNKKYLKDMANSADYNDQFDDWYTEEAIRDTKNKRREKDRHASREDNFYY